jgi:hypothetical protein
MVVLVQQTMPLSVLVEEAVAWVLLVVQVETTTVVVVEQDYLPA